MILEIVLTILLLWFVIKNFVKSKNAPPGPFKWPVIGNLLYLRSQSSYPPEALDKLSKKYGNIMSLQMGAINIVALCKHEDIKTLFSMSDLGDRDSIDLLRDRNMHKNLGIIWANGESLETLKRFSVRTMKDFGFGKSAFMDIVIQDEMKKFIKYLENKIQENNGIVQMSNLFTPLTLNITWNFVTGNRYSYSNHRIQKLLEMNNDFVKATDIIGITVAFPMLRKLFPNKYGKNVQMKIINEFHQFLREEIQIHESNENRKTDPQSFLEVFINKIHSEIDKQNTHFTEEQLLITLFDIFQGGTVTTSSALEFAFLFLMLNPDVQAKIQAEIDEVIPENDSPDMSHKSKMVYTQAAVYEVLRFGLVVPQPTPRIATKDIFYKGYVIKKGTSVMANLHSVMNNKEIWEDPQNFRPERFINANGTLDQTLCDTTNVFGYGKRYCIGSNLAMNEIFFTVASLLQNMSFQIVPGQPIPNTKAKVGLTMNPYPYESFVTFKKMKISYALRNDQSSI